MASVKRILLTFILLVTVPAPWADEPSTLALDLVKQAAEHGNADAQYEVGTLYEFGYNRAKDDVTALAWYMRAGAQGHVLAAKRSAKLESRLTPAEVETARKLAERLAGPKKPPETAKPGETLPKPGR